MDFVKNNWFPSQRRAKVCLFHVCPGLPGSQQAASRYEIHSRLLSSPKDPSAWEKNESLLNAGFPERHYSARDQFALQSLPPDVAERSSDFAKERLASQPPRMLSSLVIARLMDENRSQEDGPPLVLPLPRALARPASAHRRALAPFPDRLGIPAPSEDGGPRPPSPGGPRRGFASITVTARRVRPAASAPAAWGAGPDSLCPKCRCSPGLAGGSHPRQQRGPLTCAEIPPRHGPVGRQRSPQARTRPCGAPRERAVGAHGEDAGGGLGADSSPPGRDALVFSSCVHLRVSRPCPKAGCALGKALWVPVQPAAPAAGPQTHRSVLSLSLNCSSHRPTADGGDGTANAEPMGSLEPGLGRPPLALPGPAWGPAPPDSQPQEQPAVERVFLGTGPCPWSGSPPLGDREWTDAGTQQLAVKKRKEDPAASRTGCPGNQLSIHIPGWSFRAVETKVFSGSSKAQQGQSHGTLSAPSVQQKPCKQSPPDGDSSPSEDGQSSDLAEPTERRRPRFLTPKVPWSGFLCPFQELYTSLQEDSVQIGRDFPKGDYTCCDLVVRIKDCEDPSTPKPSPAPPLPQTSDLLEDGSEPQQTTTGSMTLQEALEVHKPQFISRSQERLKKLEHMVQQRKAQQKEKLGQKQSPSPLRTSKKQFTIPHPLSDNLFKPKERCISEKEMHMRSRRIYNNLPEVKKKKEEQKKRVILQSNRLRAEVFKKQLLDQLLQRNAV
ncbi:(E2-independent) E3 ubiquitin-conjugating enzyme FATS [Perognathus longimembris pacificus]|uniref:(E2-independent) E3 ubiquitin-conjugating enzyme FATS n=1 Tax=Perognathus longimembris pacificus TaxID=214514 RepID=UPI0020192946|nr:(E2-independent) E3 ubiquitin-conjugating enzyme FATS [Perognathus longimembris pacificus]